MFIKLLFITALSFSSPLVAQEEVATIARAEMLMNQKSYTESVKVFQRVFEQKEVGRVAYYNAACTAALAGQPELAFTWLNKSIDKNWRDIRHLKADTDLDSLHNLPEWQTLLNKLQAKLDVLEKNYDQALKKELEAINVADQKTRLNAQAIERQFGKNSKELKAAWKEIDRIDAINLKRVTEILDSKGWLGSDEVGEEASATLWLVIQHADTKEWEKYLPIMRQAVKDKKASGSQLALLEDRYLAFGLHKRQIYGSQLQSIKGITTLMPIEDPDHVDERRASVGLQPIAEYLQNWNLTWDLAKYKKAWATEKKKNKKE